MKNAIILSILIGLNAPLYGYETCSATVCKHTKIVRIEKDLVEDLVTQYREELMASRTYEALSLWCRLNGNWQGFASYFKAQATEERTHAEWIQNHLLDAGINPGVPALDAVEIPSFEQLEKKHNPAPLFEMALNQEQMMSERVESLYFKAHDLKNSYAMKLLKKLTDEQEEEELKFSDWLEEAKQIAESGNLVDLRALDAKLLAREQ